MENTKKKILFTATVWGFFNFLGNDIRMLTEAGWEVHVATNFNYINKPIVIDGIVVKHQIDFARSPLKKDNITAYRQLKALLRQEHFDIVHCHTVIASVLTRLAAKRYRKSGTRLFYTAHGFNFYKGAPAKNWLLYYPVERLLSRVTDLQITINKEDYALAKKRLFAAETVYVPGVGIDLERFSKGRTDAEAKRAELGVKDDEIMLLSVGEYSARKNHSVVIKALAGMERRDIKLFIAGNGKLEKELKELSSALGMGERVNVMGYRTDISQLCQAADAFILPSHYEGLSVALMEAIACETPVLCSRIRGSVDLVTDEEWMFDQRSVEDTAACLANTIGSRSRGEFAAYAAETVKKNREHLEAFGSAAVAERMREIYGLQ